jgi:hypothetical protein
MTQLELLLRAELRTTSVACTTLGNHDAPTRTK